MADEARTGGAAARVDEAATGGAAARVDEAPTGGVATSVDQATTGGAAVGREHAGDPATADIVRRLRSVEGHVRGVERMVEDGAYCIDVLNQILAVQRALKKVSGLVLDRHLHHCVTSAVRGEDADERERVLREIMEVFRATGRT